MSKIVISCADLVKKSAFSMCHVRKKNIKPVVSQRMIVGDASAKKKSKSPLIELVGTYNADKDYDLKYTFDEIIDDKDKYVLVEHKHFDADEVEEWFLNSSLLQVAFYNSLVKVNPNKLYKTAQYELDKGNPEYNLVMNKPVISILDIKNKKYQVEVTEPQKIVTFYLKKTVTTFDYTMAKQFDELYKGREFELLKPFFNYNLV